ncbi:hypothetical protein PSTG_05399 [Puccinia striiformis f. sp. tritici PST-78]|uniref:Uncharacterized protein n=1 Tax=Puccinia striiformis f. sp. tritici PST-78 TaxID=1165861 RepID=A0A0L0VPV0_9BASI|nr:hypothetical protein PSTG_05399 [Puccinia striiformis f. sp. tritici PST-78]
MVPPANCSHKPARQEVGRPCPRTAWTGQSDGLSDWLVRAVNPGSAMRGFATLCAMVCRDGKPVRSFRTSQSSKTSPPDNHQESPNTKDALEQVSHQKLLHPTIIKNLPTQKMVLRAIQMMYILIQEAFCQELKMHQGATYLGVDAWQAPNGFDIIGAVIYITGSRRINRAHPD